MTVISNETKQLLPYAMLRGFGPKTIQQIAHLENFAELSRDEVIRRTLGPDSDLENAIWDAALEASEYQIDESQRHGVRILSVLDSDYPQLLSATDDDPSLLWVKGTLSSTPENSVAVIGTRKPTHHGELIARRIADYFVEQKWSVVSGLAIGCDTAAHESALDTGGHTVAVMAHGLQMVSPAANKKLADRILSKGGALVSEYSLGQSVKSFNFVKRDRTQAGLSQGVVMVQSDLKGGSLHATRAALSYNRWIAVPFPTNADRNALTPKVEANLVIANGTPEEKQKLLRCGSTELDHVTILWGREDYASLINRPVNQKINKELLQQQLV